MKEIGESFREARETIGISKTEVIKDLNITESQLDNLEDGNIYDAIYNFYSKLVDKSKKTQKKNVLDIENNVVLLSEDRKEDTADKLMIINYGEILRIKFIRTGSNIITFKPRKSINIKFRMYDSRYDEYTQDIIKLYKDINGIEARKVYRR